MEMKMKAMPWCRETGSRRPRSGKRKQMNLRKMDERLRVRAARSQNQLDRMIGMVRDHPKVSRERASIQQRCKRRYPPNECP